MPLSSAPKGVIQAVLTSEDASFYGHEGVELEEALPKNRILMLYLNVVEWGEGVYGIEADAQEHFRVSASRLTVAQGAILAAMLPAPRKRRPPERRMKRKTRDPRHGSTSIRF